MQTANVFTTDKGKLVPLIDNPNGQGDQMLIKIETGTNEDYYINFNRASHYNFLTQEGEEQVLITKAGNGDDKDVK